MKIVLTGNNSLTPLELMTIAREAMRELPMEELKSGPASGSAAYIRIAHSDTDLRWYRALGYRMGGSNLYIDTAEVKDSEVLGKSADTDGDAEKLYSDKVDEVMEAIHSYATTNSSNSLRARLTRMQWGIRRNDIPGTDPKEVKAECAPLPPAKDVEAEPLDVTPLARDI